MIEKDHYDIDSVSSDSITDIEQLQYVLTVQRQCTKLTFTIGTSSSSVILNLTSSILSKSESRIDLLYTQLQINNFYMMKCPPAGHKT